MFNLLVLGVFLSLASCKASNLEFLCPEGFVKLNNHCYHFSKDTATWYDAMKKCVSMNSTLLSVETIEENCAIKIHLYHLDNPASTWYWMSGTDMFKEGEFLWMSTWKPLTYTEWCRNQPDNMNTSEHCMHYWKVDNHTNCWNDTGCNGKMRYICELDSFKSC